MPNIFIAIVAAIIFSIVATSCHTTDTAIRERDTILLTRIEAAVEEYDRRIEHAQTNTTNATSTVERIIYLFDEYTRAVEDLRNTIIQLQAEIEQGKNNSSSNFSSIYSGEDNNNSPKIQRD